MSQLVDTVKTHMRIGDRVVMVKLYKTQSLFVAVNR